MTVENMTIGKPTYSCHNKHNNNDNIGICLSQYKLSKINIVLVYQNKHYNKISIITNFFKL